MSETDTAHTSDFVLKPLWTFSMEEKNNMPCVIVYYPYNYSNLSILLMFQADLELSSIYLTSTNISFLLQILLCLDGYRHQAIFIYRFQILDME